MSRVAVLADIHGNLPALQAVVDDLEHRGIDTVINLGDHASGPLWPQETVAFLMQQSWLQIAGNHDRQLVQQNPETHGLSDRYAFERLSDPQKRWLQALPAQLRCEPDLLLCHGTPSNDSLYLLETVAHGTVRLARQTEIIQRLGGVRARIVLCGHSHTPRVIQVDETMIVVNPGSIGLPAYADAEPEPHVVENGSPQARYAILEQRGLVWRIELIAVAYAHQRAANQARDNGRFEWESGLRTGYLPG